jgi:predicted AAA+ superfamily ATPase
MKALHRKLYTDLLHWKGSATRKPLLLRGARQVGKSYLVETFGAAAFEQLIVINFE